MLIALLPSFLLTALLIELTPGPNMAYLSLVSALQGRRAGLAATSGIALGLLLIGMTVAIGLAGMIAASPIAFQTLRWAGVLYLIWLAWEAWASTQEVSPGQVIKPTPAIRHFRRGLITNLLNPKAGLFFIAILPGFTDPAIPMIPQTASLVIIYVLLATLVHLTLVMLAGRANHWFNNNRRQHLARKTFAMLLLAVAIWFMWSSRMAI